ncbi:MAG TPA: alpha/beta hydrolase [Acidobacteriaceae bacterium]|nr:alpha/beta hydrolase [Acidobacteriaceae bacterium]
MSRRGAVSRRGFLGGGLAAAAQLAAPVAARADPKARTFVLVHGAWHGGWCWRRVADRLTAKGHYVVAPTLSGVGERSHLKAEDIDLTTHVEDVVGEMKWKDLDDVVLVGHSYGGMVITGVAEQMRERIAAIVYLDAFMPGDGQSLADFTNRTSWPEPVTPAPPATYFHVNEKDAAWVQSKLTAHPTRCFTQKLKVTGAYQSIAKKLYVRAPLFAQKGFDQALEQCRADKSWQTATVTCGHDVMIDQPGELAAMLEKFA